MSLLALAQKFEKSLSRDRKRKISRFLNIKMNDNMNELKDLINGIKKDDLNDEEHDWLVYIEKFIKLYEKIR